MAEADRTARRILYAASSDCLSALGYVIAAIEDMPDHDLRSLITEVGRAVREAGRRGAESLTVYWAQLGALAWTEAKCRGIDPRGLASRPEVGGYL